MPTSLPIGGGGLVLVASSRIAAWGGPSSCRHPEPWCQVNKEGWVPSLPPPHLAKDQG